jgi:hypothetical protein
MMRIIEQYYEWVYRHYLLYHNTSGFIINHKNKRLLCKTEICEHFMQWYWTMGDECSSGREVL